MTTLRLIESQTDLRDNVARFNRDARARNDLSRPLARQTWYWVFDSEEQFFGPAKFVGFKSMTFPTYESGMAGTTEGEKFDGHSTRTAIESTIEHSFDASESLSRELIVWGNRLLGPGLFDGVDQGKWQFLTLAPSRRYWAFFADPKIYDIEAAVRELDEDTWTVKQSDVRKGDRVIIWRGLKDGHRGIVGLGEVLTDPEVIPPPKYALKYFLTESLQAPERRVLITYQLPSRFPIWLDDDQSGALQALSVSKAHGGTVFKVEPDQWKKVIDLAGGWLERPTVEDVLAAVQPSPTHPGQGFITSPIERRAIELHAMRRAEQYFVSQGYDIQDVSKNRPYDLHCTKGEATLHVEVKGTTGAGESVFLTRNEVEHARSNSSRMGLFILRQIKLRGSGDDINAFGGEPIIACPWVIDETALSPMSFSYGTLQHLKV